MFGCVFVLFCVYVYGRIDVLDCCCCFFCFLFPPSRFLCVCVLVCFVLYLTYLKLCVFGFPFIQIYRFDVLLFVMVCMCVVVAS